MPKQPHPSKRDDPAADLTVSERILLFCLASNTDWIRAGIAPSIAQAMTIKNYVVRDSAGKLALTDKGREAFYALIASA